MSLSFAHDRLLMPDRVVTRPVKGETILLDTDTGRYFALDDIGARALAVLTASATIEEAYRVLLAEYQVDPARLREDLEALIGALVTQGLVEVIRG
jgi:hypothetical protein